MGMKIRGSTQILDGTILNAQINASAAIDWTKVNKTGSSLADLATRSAADLSSGTLADGRLSSNVPLLNTEKTFSAIQNFTLGLRERGRSAAVGVWTAVTFAAGNFTASSGDWTLVSGDQTTFAYTLVGMTLTVAFSLLTTTVSATPQTLKISIPGGHTAARRMGAPFAYIDNGTAGIGLAEVNPAGTVIDLYKDFNATAWQAATNTTYVEGVLSFEIA